jgi:phosphoribosylanthranilate isomerase
MRVRVKICGITDEAALDAAVAAGADAIGFVFADSPRRISLGRAVALAGRAPRRVTTVAVFDRPSPDRIAEVLAALPGSVVQAEADESLAGHDRFLAVFHDGPDVVRDVEWWRRRHGWATPVLVDGPGRGGGGLRVDAQRARSIRAAGGRTVLAGGLTPDNVGPIVRSLAPWAVDVSSGVERAPGVKDPERIERFVERARRAAASLPHGCHRGGTR